MTNDETTISEIKKDLERAYGDLSKSEHQLRMLTEIVQTIPHVIWIGNSEGSVTFLNQAWTTWTGRGLDESLGTKWAESVHPDDLETLLAKWERAYAGGEPYEGECRFKRADGSDLHCNFIGLPVRDEEGNVTNWIGIDVDVTPIKTAKAALAEKNEELSKKISELEKLNDLMVDRELKMVELKKRIEELERDREG